MHFWKQTILCLLLLLFCTVASAKIVFLSKHGKHVDFDGFFLFEGVYEIYAMEDNGSDLTLITTSQDAGHPRWSADGNQIVYSAHSTIHLMNADGTNIQHITYPIKNKMFDCCPTFSPDGEKVAFTRTEEINRTQENNTIVLHLKTGKLEKIANHYIISPDWSPDGKQIVFLIHDVPFIGTGGNVYIMDSDGGNMRRLVLEAPQGELFITRHSPRWSPNGKQILYTQEEFTQKRKDPNGIINTPKTYRYYICNLNGETVRQLNIPIHWNPGSIDWADNGKSVVFSARQIKLNEPELPPDEAPSSNIYKYHIATEKITTLLERPVSDIAVDWVSNSPYVVSPAGKLTLQWGHLKQMD